MRKIFIGADSAGFALKEEIKVYLKDKGYDVCDLGTDSDASCHYPIFAKAVCENVKKNLGDSYGILICGTGIGMSIVANKVKGIRCGHCHDVFSAKMTRLHNDANVLALGERVVGPGLMVEIVDAFLSTEFSFDERHERRVAKIKAVEEENFK